LSNSVFGASQTIWYCGQKSVPGPGNSVGYFSKSVLPTGRLFGRIT
jgi:hypothetical protein